MKTLRDEKIENMWKLRKLGRYSFLRHLAKYVFSICYYTGRVITIRRGSLKGYKWLCNCNQQFWMPLGLYESETADWLERHVGNGATFFDVSANAGYFTLLGSKCVGAGRVIAFEPIPVNVEMIKSNLELNGIGNVIVEPRAVSDKTAACDFAIEKNTANSHLAEIAISHAQSAVAGVIRVESIRLDDY
ncbi:FkbM family methyltransferase, partial [Nitrospiraceae bacterium AH_259_D15_M11_P09]|nr:FkbM family methyltransferase [Nitrospiraceae bacterium AH_259_D15_M11_P09]